MNSNKYYLSLPLLLVTISSVSTFAQSRICGYVTDINAQSALSGATVFLNDEYNLPIKPDIRMRTDSSGYFDFHNIEPGKYSVNVWSYFEFKADSFVYVYQPGFLEVRTDTNYFEIFGQQRCYPMNFECDMEAREDEFDKFSSSLQNALLKMWEQLPNDSLRVVEFQVDSTEFTEFKDHSWAMMALGSTVNCNYKTIDSLFTPAVSSYIRKKDW